MKCRHDSPVVARAVDVLSDGQDLLYRCTCQSCGLVGPQEEDSDRAVAAFFAAFSPSVGKTGRKRKYRDNAERQAAYRRRQRVNSSWSLAIQATTVADLRRLSAEIGSYLPWPRSDKEKPRAISCDELRAWLHRIDQLLSTIQASR